MDLSELSPAPSPRKQRKRVGRGPGSGTGKTSGRGHKGQKSRSGYSRRAGFEGGQMPLMRRLPKRGFTQVSRHHVAEVNLDVLDAAFRDGDEVSAAVLVERNLINEAPGGVKVLGRGAMGKKLKLVVTGISAGAREKVESAGGSVELLVPATARAVKNRTKGKSKVSK